MGGGGVYSLLSEGSQTVIRSFKRTRQINSYTDVRLPRYKSRSPAGHTHSVTFLFARLHLTIGPQPPDESYYQTSSFFLGYRSLSIHSS